MIDDQLTFGDPVRLAEEGMARAEKAADPEWIARWDAAIRELARSGVGFTTDDVRALAGPPEDHPNAAGARLKRAEKAGIIRHTGSYRPSTRPALHHHPLGVWVGTGAA